MNRPHLNLYGGQVFMLGCTRGMFICDSSLLALMCGMYIVVRKHMLSTVNICFLVWATIHHQPILVAVRIWCFTPVSPISAEYHFGVTSCYNFMLSEEGKTYHFIHFDILNTKLVLKTLQPVTRTKRWHRFT